MKIVIVTSFLPYPINAGGVQAQFNLLNKLRSKHKIVMAYPLNRDNTLENQQALSQLWPDVQFYPYPFYKQLLSFRFLCSIIKKAIFRSVLKGDKLKIFRALDRYRAPSGYLYKDFLKMIIDTETPDIIQAEFLPNLNLPSQVNSSTPIIFVHHEIGFQVLERGVKGIKLTDRQKRKLEDRRLEEIKSLNQFDSVITLTPTDRLILMDAGVTNPIYVSPAAVSTQVKEYSNWKKRLVFIGGYQHLPNREGFEWFINQVVPLVEWKKWQNIEMLIIGKGWPKEYDGCFNGLNVRGLGFVDDFSDIVSGSIVIVPILSGSGMRMKILDAAALGAPFVSTKVGAEGLLFTDEESCIIADTPRLFAEKLEMLMDNQVLQQRIAINAQNVFNNNYSIPALTAVREQVYLDVVREG